MRSVAVWQCRILVVDLHPKGTSSKFPGYTVWTTIGPSLWRREPPDIIFLASHLSLEDATGLTVWWQILYELATMTVAMLSAFGVGGIVGVLVSGFLEKQNLARQQRITDGKKGR
jgi:hypothetical protein